ncbi:MAG: dithiol-disulfide isomerase [Chloroflexi bacterium]|jgi:predicted DsbA family dithiol-disulfide isomerase|nr:dithiol-disulfide isomerase [Chloroflexota bacterium]
MSIPSLEVYASLDCPYAYLATYRLRQIWPDYRGKVSLVWRALSLEYVNARPVTKPLIEAERSLFAQIEPALPYTPWSAPEWLWPTTMWPAFEALACAQAQSPEAGFEMSWALRHAFFGQSTNIALRHVLLDIAKRVAEKAPLDLARFEADWDSGRYKESVIAESRRGWHELRLDGSVTFVLPDGERVTNPALGEIDFDEEQYVLRGYTPFAGDPLASYRKLLDRAIASAS